MFNAVAGVKAVAVCCRARDPNCTYRAAGPSPAGHDVAVEAACAGSEQALGQQPFHSPSSILSSSRSPPTTFPLVPSFFFVASSLSSPSFPPSSPLPLSLPPSSPPLPPLYPPASSISPFPSFIFVIFPTFSPAPSSPPYVLLSSFSSSSGSNASLFFPSHLCVFFLLCLLDLFPLTQTPVLCSEIFPVTPQKHVAGHRDH